ncbi:ATP-binding protein [Streptomyces sp. NBC_01218]|uniref:ATP-binding protein n=1 Tax=Streptomyces sp. NBC_01218 TaxID=2903780 RepID=UPI002E166370|nr:ATP-binding protein [Streptomyces sp. NBC_01218]
MTPAQEMPATEPVLREDVLSYTPVPAAVPRCRRRASRLVAEWGYPELADDTALLVSELATNALLHGGVRGRLFRLRLALTASALRIEVTDARTDRLPDTRTPLDADCYGRGLLIVAELADHWGVEHRTVGKTVFAELSLRRPRSTPPAPR